MSKIFLFFKQRSAIVRHSILTSTTWYYRGLSVLYRLLRGIVLFLISSNYRNDRLTEVYYRKHVFQPNSYTSNSSYPELFKITHNYFITHQHPLKICSFGCSTGCEVSALLGYFPTDVILLILDHCDFSFTSTDVYNRYCTLEVEGNYLIRQRPLYNSFNHREAEVSAGFRVFQKLA